MFSAFFSTSETSMMSVNRHRLNFLVNQGHKKAKRTKMLLERTEDVLSAAATNLVQIFVGKLSVHFLGSVTSALLTLN